MSHVYVSDQTCSRAARERMYSSVVTMLRDITREDIVLEDKRALLRPLLPSDEANLLPFALHEPELWQFGLANPASAEALHAYVAQAIIDRHRGLSYPFIVFDKRANAYAGSTRFYDIQRTADTALLGFTWYGKAFQRTGLNRHCKMLLLRFAFETWNLERLEFRTDARNERSRRAIEALGATEEGVLRSHLPKPNGHRRDTVILSILRSEWLGGGGAALAHKLETTEPP